MPHKTNAIGCEMMLVAGRVNAALPSALHVSGVQEHERSTHGWHVEWFVLPQMVALTAGALDHAHAVIEHLVVDRGRMRENIRNAGDVVMSEALVVLLSEVMSVDEARSLVTDAGRRAHRQRSSIVDAVRVDAAARGVADLLDWTRVADPSAYLGVATQIVDRVVADAKRVSGLRSNVFVTDTNEDP